MKKTSLLLLAAAAAFVITLPVHAQTGCVNSPENPTVVLGLVGTAGAFVAATRTRLAARRKSK